MKYLSPLSCLLAAFAIAAWPFLNTMLVPWLAGGAVTAGSVAGIAGRKTHSRVNTALSVGGAVVGGIVLLCWAAVMFLAWSAATGHPM